MSAESPDAVAAGPLVKESVAMTIKQAIMEGRLKPGERVIEGKWAQDLRAAQTSVREGINLLIAEGFLVKDAGRSARVVSYQELDVAQIFEVRAAIEGLAAELSSRKAVDLSPLEMALAKVRAAIQKEDLRELVQEDLQFHLALVEASGNPVLLDLARRLLLPFFAFIQIKLLAKGRTAESFKGDLIYHEFMLQAIREGNPALAEQVVRHCLSRLADSAHRFWSDNDR